MFDVEETKSHSGVTLQTFCWKFCHILVKLQSSNNCASCLFSQMIGAVGLVVY